MSAEQALRHLVRDDEAPLMWAGVTEAEQRTYDTTARKLNRFLQNDVDAPSTGTPPAKRPHGGDGRPIKQESSRAGA